MKKILITGFQSFAGRVRNGSDFVAAALEVKHSGLVVSQSLSTTWEAALNPSVPENCTHVLGLGEGLDYGVYVERLGTPLRGGKDVNGQDPPKLGEGADKNPVILDLTWGEREQTAAGLAVPSARELGLYPLLPGIVVNHFAGFFCCNGRAFALGKLRESRPDLRVGFIHVPPMDGWEVQNPGQPYVEIMARAVTAVLVGNRWL